LVNRVDILNTAVDLTTSERRQSYGEPLINHERIAKIWEVILGVKVTPSQVALCMVGTKLARLVETPDHLDSFIDGAAYMAIAGEISKPTIKEQNGNSETGPAPRPTTSYKTKHKPEEADTRSCCGNLSCKTSNKQLCKSSIAKQ